METLPLTPPYGPELVGTAGERDVLERFLDFYRRVTVSKVYGLPDEDTKRRLVPSLTTLAGLLRHLTIVERNWFQHVLAGRPATADGGDGGWSVDDVTVDELVVEYEQECERSRAVAAGLTLEDVGSHPELGVVSLRWVYVHMIDETARHAGHADILRELTDGVTGAV
ncbi:DinB family protein [Planosporangium thailandense]|uniref:DinB family protein n=1 Tax=Planosporangium thailandense TaxID=765197 RepID=A0ABX0Y1Z1_9ACTN|nr:DinB family protein [Planosporangium thailandense]NJC72361.1 DinB family protein [Planosporangium thailandense]